MVLPLLQINNIPAAFEDLKRDSPVVSRDLFNYFENFWMTNVPLHIWNVSNLRIRTSNNSEGIDIHFLRVQWVEK